MINYIIQIVFFQALFLAVYDLFLQKETFFKWNRVYLLLTPILSFVIPLLKFDSIKNTVPQDYMILLPEVVLNPQVVIEQTIQQTESVNYFNWIYAVGIILLSVLFLVKLSKILHVINSNTIVKKKNYRLVLLENKQSAFSFFNFIFIDKNLADKKELQIIQHELVHSKQLHTLDLLFFEIFKIVMWFNPMLYIYQKRITLLHEYISDSEVVKETDKHSYFNKLLSETFKVENISFVNQFYKHSFIKKRITMITKNKSQKMKQLKYLVLIPVLASMLLYSSCETVDNSNRAEEAVAKKELVTIYFYDEGNFITSKGTFDSYFDKVLLYNDQKINSELKLKTFDYEDLSSNEKLEYDKIVNTYKPLKGGEVGFTLFLMENGRKVIVQKLTIDKVAIEDYDNSEDVPFAIIDKAPIFPGCEDSDNLKDCLNKGLRNFVQENFNTDLGKSLGLESGRQKIYVQFRILKTGAIEVLGVRAPHPELSKEAKRVVKSLPKMTPGEHNGKAVNVTYMLPISFKIE